MRKIKGPQVGDYDRIVAQLDPGEFAIPFSQADSDFTYFPHYIDNELNRYLAYFTNCLKQHTDDQSNYGRGTTKTALLDKITLLTNGLLKTIDQYYNGYILEAAKTFTDLLDEIAFPHLTYIEHIPKHHNFYRTRPSTEKRLERKDLFHNPFENRHAVNTNRYSIPGFPALYLGSSVYVCWEEFDKCAFNHLYFSRFENTCPLSVVKIQRLTDFLHDVESSITDPFEKRTALYRYLSIFPLSIACSIKTREKTGSFKPEYIIPQLLLQYVRSHKTVDGIMFPSTKVNYNTIKGVTSYNYVFPVKDIRERGYCSELVYKFNMTEPTSIELESLLDYSRNQEFRVNSTLTINLRPSLPGTISLIEGVNTPYSNTAFGNLEYIINSRATASLFDF